MRDQREEEERAKRMGSETEIEKEEDDDVLLPGFRFHPTDEELVRFYLRRKVENKPLSIEIIKEIDIYKYDPWDLPKAITAGEQDSFFFCLRGRKYRNSIRPNRVTGSGFWKATGIDKPIYSAGDCIGLKKSLVYYRGSAGKGTKTAWMMHEFRLPPPVCTAAAFTLDASAPKHEAEIWTVCRVIQRSASHKIKKPNCSWKAATSAKQLPAVDSSLHYCSTNGEEELVDAYLYNENIDQVLGGDYYWDSVHHSPLLFDPGKLPSPACADNCLFSSTGENNWDDELENIMELVADY